LSDLSFWRVNLTDDEFKFILQAANVDESEIDDCSHFTDPELIKWNLLQQRDWIVSGFMLDLGMYELGDDKLAGWPRWVQDIEYPNCPTCDGVMNQFIFQLESDDNIPWLWGDLGTGYLVQCPEHKNKVAFLWQCT